MSRLPIMQAIQRAEASGFEHFAAALRVVLASEYSPARASQGIPEQAIGADPIREARRHAWHATRRSINSRSPFGGAAS